MSEQSLFQNLILKDIIGVNNNRLQILKSIDITSYGSRAWSYTIQEIGKLKGTQYLFELGMLMGEDAADEIIETLKSRKDFVPPTIQEFGNMILVTGFGVVEVRENGSKIEIEIKENHIIEFGAEMYGAESLICHFYKGVYNAFVDKYKGKKYSCITEKCYPEGKDKCVMTFEEKNVQ